MTSTLIAYHEQLMIWVDDILESRGITASNLRVCAGCSSETCRPYVIHLSVEGATRTCVCCRKFRNKMVIIPLCHCFIICDENRTVEGDVPATFLSDDAPNASHGNTCPECPHETTTAAHMSG